MSRSCTKNDPLKIGVLISGSGSNLQAIIDAINTEDLPAEIVHVISSRPDAYGLERARAAGIEATALNRSYYEDPIAADKLIVEKLRESGAEYVVMAGYMRKCTPELLNAFTDHVVNLHPALLPSFVGAHAIEDAYNSGVKVTGVTVHLANEEYDKGPIIAQEPVRIEEGMSLEDLESAIHAVEHKLYPSVIKMIAQGRMSLDDNRHVVIKPSI